jgi:hypothetical protein
MPTYTLWIGPEDNIDPLGHVELLDGDHTQYSRIRELMYRLKPILEEYGCPVDISISDGNVTEYPGDPAITKEEPLTFEQWRATYINDIYDLQDPQCAFDHIPRLPDKSFIRTYAAGLGMWFCEQLHIWRCYTTDLYEGDLDRCESALYAYYIGTFQEYISGTEPQ